MLNKYNKKNSYIHKHIHSYIEKYIHTYIQSIKNYRNHKSLIEKIRKKALELKKKWTIQIKWIKAHEGNYGNELADGLAKEATKNKETIYKKIPKRQIVQQVKQQSIGKWQSQWEQTTKGRITKQFFPNIKERLGKRI
jgi:hypothetical protein